MVLFSLTIFIRYIFQAHCNKDRSNFLKNKGAEKWVLVNCFSPATSVRFVGYPPSYALK